MDPPADRADVTFAVTPGGDAPTMPGWVFAPDSAWASLLPWPPALPIAMLELRTVEGRRTRIGRYLVIPAWAYTGLEILAGDPLGDPLVLSAPGDPILGCAAAVVAAVGEKRLALLYALGGYRALLPIFLGHSCCRKGTDPCTVAP